MTNFPNDFDDDTTLPFVNNNITEVGGDAINALRDAVFEIEQNIGLGAHGTTSSIAARLGISFNADGSLRPSAITSLGLVTLPITEDQISNTAEIPESKLRLDHRTQDLFNYIRDLSGDVNLAISWMSITGIKLEPHLIGAIYRHTLDQIDVHSDTTKFLDNKFRTLRDNLQSYNLVNDINNELLAHQWADGSPFGTIQNVVTNNGSVYPSNYGHTASGIFLNTSRFTTIPQTALDLQLFAEFIDGASIFLLGTRIQNLYTNGISKVSRSSSLVVDGYGQNLVPPTPAIAYLKNIGNSSSPFDSIDTGDDIIEFKPSVDQTVNHTFDSQFNLVRTGDIVRINYGNIEVPFVIKEKKYIQNGGNKKFIVRIAGKNLDYSPNASARIDKPLFNSNKYGVLSISGVNNEFSEMPSLIVSSPRGAQALGVGFTPEEFDQTHYLLYLAIYPTGHPQDGYTILPGIDVTGNQGTTPGAYTLDSIVEATNAAFRKNGYNYRFIAFSYQGEFGITMADPYGNAAFSILNAVISPSGVLDETGTGIVFPNNVIDMFPAISGPPEPPDPLGFGPFGSAVSSPAYQGAYASAEASQNPTKIFVPLLRNNFYVNGVEKERLTLEIGQALDGYGDGYWVGRVLDVQALAGRVQTTYRVPLDLSASTLKAGKTLVVQSLGSGSLVDFGRFIIQSVTFGCSPDVFTDITVYDAVHGKGFSPTTTIGVDGYVALYFNSDSVSFNAETATDYTNLTPFKRHFEVYVDQNGQTFTHERGRMLISGTSIAVNGSAGSTLYSFTELAKFDIIKISPKLRGAQEGNVNLINLNIDSYDATTGIYVGRLSTSSVNQGPTVTGKKGEITRFYDGGFVDYIDFILDVNVLTSSFTNQKISVQLFPTLSLDDEIMLIGTCQINDTTKTVSRIRDERQFGNTSEKDLSTSALNYISLPERLLHFNGVIRGFDIADTDNDVVTLKGGVALVNGNIKQLNYQTQSIPKVVESFAFTFWPINWALCVNSIGELVTIPLLDYDVVLGTPNAPNRIVSLFSSVSNTTYESDCTTFANLINNRKDLTILYIVSETITGNAPNAYTYKDVRRFINDQDSSIPVVVTTANNQGNFHSFDVAATWLRLDSAFQNEIQIKGTQSVSDDPRFYTDPVGGASNYGQHLNIIGQSSGAALTFNNDVDLSYIRFQDLTLNFNGDVTLLSGAEFDNCAVNLLGTVTFGESAAKTTVFRNCKIRINMGASSPLAGGSELLPTTMVNVLFDNCTVDFGSQVVVTNVKFRDGSYTFYYSGTFTNVNAHGAGFSFAATIDTTDTHLISGTVSSPASKTFNLVGSNFTLEGNAVTYSANGASGSDLVGAANGMVFADVSATLSNVKVRDNAVQFFFQDHYPLVSMRLNAVSSSIQDVDISKNKFTDFYAAEDYRAIVSFVSTIASAVGATHPKFPKLTNIIIDSNTCNHNQMILVSALRTAPFTNPLPAVANVRVSNNVCGTIGYMVASNSLLSGTSNSGTGAIMDKKDHLLITGNTCKLITNLDSIGDYVPFNTQLFPSGSTNTVEVATAPVTISENAAHWIQVGASSYQGGNTFAKDGVMIVNNRLSPADSSYLSNFTDATYSVTPANVGILLRADQSPVGNTRSIISGNNLIQEPMINISNSLVTNYYDTAIAAFNNAIVTDNNVWGVVNRPSTPLADYSAILYLGMATGEYLVSQNNFSRNGLTLQAYVKGVAGATGNTSITNNIFDSQYIDAGNTIETVGVDIPSTWAFHSNRNQIFYREISLTDDTYSINGAFGGSAENLAWGVAPAELQLIKDATVNMFISAYRQIGPNNWSEIGSTEYITVHDFNDSTSNTRNWSRRGAIEPYLPENVKVLNAKIGYFASSWTGANVLDYSSAPAYNAASLTIFKHKNTNTSVDPVNGVLNPRDNITSHTGSFGFDLSVEDKTIAVHFIASSGDETNVRTNPVYLTVDLSAKDYCTGKGYRLAFEVDQSYKKGSGATGRHYFFDWSPVVLKCIYR